MALNFNNKIENEGQTPEGRLSAAEFNSLVNQCNRNESDINEIKKKFGIDDGSDFKPQTNLIEIEYKDLISLRNSESLVPGAWYRLTNYTCTTTQEETRAQNHRFDILILATTKNSLSEECRAIQHEGESYFANCNLNAWKIWYCVDNDTTRFDWVDEESGTGVIYRMIDEWSNDIPYDFKNIQFQRWYEDEEIEGYCKIHGSSGDYIWAYTFSCRHDKETTDSYTTASFNSGSQIDILGYNVIKPYNIRVINDDDNCYQPQVLNNIVFIQDSFSQGELQSDYSNNRLSHDNFFDLQCCNITCYAHNTFNYIDKNSYNIVLLQFNNYVDIGKESTDLIIGESSFINFTGGADDIQAYSCNNCQFASDIHKIQLKNCANVTILPSTKNLTVSSKNLLICSGDYENQSISISDSSKFHNVNIDEEGEIIISSI